MLHQCQYVGPQTSFWVPAGDRPACHGMPWHATGGYLGEEGRCAGEPSAQVEGDDASSIGSRKPKSLREDMPHLDLTILSRVEMSVLLLKSSLFVG